MLNNPGFDTEVKRFKPSRANPFYKRYVRKFYCQERLPEVNKFTQMNFKIHIPEMNCVVGSCKLCLPLRLEAKDINDFTINMHPMHRKAAQNIAVSAYPQKAFSQMTLVINDKVYTERPNTWGHILATCWQSKDTMGFADNHSLLPVVNTKFVTNADDEWRTEDDSTSIIIQADEFENQHNPMANNLTEANPGFVERARVFVQSLDGLGVWTDTMRMGLNMGVFSNEARGEQTNDAIPYIENMLFNVNWYKEISGEERNNTTTALKQFIHPGRSVTQGLFQFATPSSLNNLPLTDVAADFKGWPSHFDITFTGKPYLECEFFLYERMLPTYELHGFSWQEQRSAQFRLPYVKNHPRANWHEQMSHNTSKRQIPLDVQMRLLSVPTRFYVWAEPVDWVKSRYGFGGCRRTCKLSNFRISVNQKVDQVFSPNDELLFKWFKRQSNCVLEYGAWKKSPIYIFTPNEIGLTTWLANNGKLSSIKIAAEASLTSFQYSQYIPFTSQEECNVMGYSYQDTFSRIVPVQNDADIELTTEDDKHLDNTTGFTAIYTLTNSMARHPYPPNQAADINLDDALSSHVWKYEKPDATHSAELFQIKRPCPIITSYFQGLVFARINLTANTAQLYWGKSTHSFVYSGATAPLFIPASYFAHNNANVWDLSDAAKASWKNSDDSIDHSAFDPYRWRPLINRTFTNQRSILQDANGRARTLDGNHWVPLDRYDESIFNNNAGTEADWEIPLDLLLNSGVSPISGYAAPVAAAGHTMGTANFPTTDYRNQAKIFVGLVQIPTPGEEASDSPNAIMFKDTQALGTAQSPNYDVHVGAIAFEGKCKRAVRGSMRMNGVATGHNLGYANRFFTAASAFHEDFNKKFDWPYEMRVLAEFGNEQILMDTRRVAASQLENLVMGDSGDPEVTDFGGARQSAAIVPF